MSEQPPTDGEFDIHAFESMDVYQQRAAIERLADERAEALEQYRSLVEHLRVKSHSLDARDKELYQTAVSRLSIDELTHPDLITMAKVHQDPIVHADSFFRKIIERRRKKQLGAVPEKYLGIGKERDQEFAEILGIRMPELHYTGSLADIPKELRADTLLKPTNSSDSRGAYYLFHERNIYSVQHSHTLRSWDEMIASIVSSLGEDAITTPTWQIQELVYEDDVHPARDIKFHTFYGQIGLILEARRHPTWQYAFFDERGNLADAGREHFPRFKDPAETVVDKGGLTNEQMDYARWLSQQIPAPYMRMDFLHTKDGLVFLEFSSAPGGSHTWSDEWDRRFGRYYLEAEMRLTDDLLAGKEYVGWREFMKQQTSPRKEPKEPDSVPRRDATPDPRLRGPRRILNTLRRS